MGLRSAGEMICRRMRRQQQKRKKKMMEDAYLGQLVPSWNLRWKADVMEIRFLSAEALSVGWGAVVGRGRGCPLGDFYVILSLLRTSDVSGLPKAMQTFHTLSLPLAHSPKSLFFKEPFIWWPSLTQSIHLVLSSDVRLMWIFVELIFFYFSFFLQQNYHSTYARQWNRRRFN